MGGNIDPINSIECEKIGLKSTSYENYTETSNNYDKTRIPVGIENIKKILNTLQSPISLCDLGCGTGNYIYPLIEKTDYICGLDLNKSMLENAKNKIPSNKKNKIEFLHASMTDIPKDNSTFDCVMYNQSIHHLPNDNNFELLYLSLKETHRILKNNGVCIINTTTEEQHRHGFWWAPIISEAINKMCTKFPMKKENDKNFLNSVRDIGFTFMGYDLITEPLQGESYFDTNGPFKTEFRNGDSSWSQATKKELDDGLKKYQELINNGQINEWINERHQLRNKYGQSIILYFQKK